LSDYSGLIKALFFGVPAIFLLMVAFAYVNLKMSQAPEGAEGLEVFGYERCNPYCERIGWEYFRHEVTNEGEECWCHKGEEIKRVV
jgi:hypothetical protein